ncbi:MAG: carboxymuconolactone decarboxylase family protein [Isosphaeraceae bacterium]|nr:carboxymuconolactone decarboxylase family protein [Isosphaeraceae bacterium]
MKGAAMLVLTRKAGERILVGADVEFVILGVAGGRVRIGVTAPASIHVCRGELGKPRSSPPVDRILDPFLAPNPGSRTMSRLKQLSPDEVEGKTKRLFESVSVALGTVPNMVRAMGNAPAVLEGYLALSGALGGGGLSAKDRERIALVVAETNGCDYCLAAHSALGRLAGLSPEELRASRGATSSDARSAHLLRLARAVVDSRGRVSSDELMAARDAGISDGDIAEVVANVALNVLTNYFNNVAQTDIDFPPAEPLAA